MAEFLSLSEAIGRNLHDGDKVAMEGFTHLIPFAAGHEVIRQKRKRLTLIRMTPDLIYDQLIGVGAAEKLVFSWGGNPGVGSLHRLRDAVENGWPQPLQLEEHSHAAMANAYEAGAANLPFAMFRGYKGVDLPKVNPAIRSVTCPYTDEVLATVPALRPDVAIIHALRADKTGNVLLEGIVGVQKEAVLAAKRSIVTVEEVVEDLGPRSPNAVILPAWTVTAIAVVPGGAFPSYAHGYYKRGNAFYKAWDPIARDRDTFLKWIDENVMKKSAGDFAQYRKARGVTHSYTATEMMTVVAARALKNDDVVFVGIGAPSAACNLARLTHAPDITLIYESGTIGTKPNVLPLSIGDGELSDTALTTVAVPEMFRYWLQGGRITVGFLGGAQIDRFANLNTTVVGDYAKPKVRLPGGGGAPEIATSCGEIFITMAMGKRAFVEKLPFITSLGHGSGPGSREALGVTTKGPTKVITDLCLIEPDTATRELTVTELYPGATREKVEAECGWAIKFASKLSETPPPSADELGVLRDLQARTKAAHGGDA